MRSSITKHLLETEMLLLLITLTVGINASYQPRIVSDIDAFELMYYNHCRYEVSLLPSAMQKFSYFLNSEHNLMRRTEVCTYTCIFLSIFLPDYGGTINVAEEMELLQNIYPEKNVINKLKTVCQMCHMRHAKQNIRDLCMASLGFMKCLRSGIAAQAWQPNINNINQRRLYETENFLHTDKYLTDPSLSFGKEIVQSALQNNTHNLQNRKTFDTKATTHDLRLNLSTEIPIQRTNETRPSISFNLTDIIPTVESNTRIENSSPTIISTTNKSIFLDIASSDQGKREVKGNVSDEHTLYPILHSEATIPINTSEQTEKMVTVDVTENRKAVTNLTLMSPKPKQLVANNSYENTSKRTRKHRRKIIRIKMNDMQTPLKSKPTVDKHTTINVSGDKINMEANKIQIKPDIPGSNFIKQIPQNNNVT